MRKLHKILTGLFILPLLVTACSGRPALTEKPGQTPVATAETQTPIDEVNAIFVDAANGSDENTGTKNAPLQTVKKGLALAKAGNTVYLRAGTYYESVKMGSGTKGKPITLAAMPGEKPVLTPTVPYTGQWQPYKGSIYVADMASIAGQIDAERSQLFVNGEAMVEARYPNMAPTMSAAMDYKRATAQAGTDSWTVVAPEALPEDIAGATVFVWPGDDGASAWTSLSSPVASVSGAVIKVEKRMGQEEEYTGLNAYNPVKGNAFFVVGALGLLDAPGEYYYDAENAKMYVYMPKGDDPAGYAISVRGNSKAIDASNSEYVNIKGLRIFGGGIYMKEAKHCRIEETAVYYADHMNVAEHASYTYENSMLVTGSFNTVTKSEFGYTAFSGIVLGGNDNVFTDNIVHNSNYSGTSFAGIYALKSERLEISQNTIRDSGRIHIYFVINTVYEKCIIRNNYMENQACLTSDCGAFYAWSVDGGGTRIYNNYVNVSTKNTNGSMQKFYDGLYLDNYCANFIVDHNIVVGGSNGLRTNLSCTNTVYANNTVIGSNCGYGIYSYPKDEAECKTVGFYNNLFINIKQQAINYNGTENGVNKVYYGPLVEGKVPVTVNEAGRMQSGNNMAGSQVSATYAPRKGSAAIDGGVVLEGVTDGFLGDAPDIGAVETGGELFAYGATWKPD